MRWVAREVIHAQSGERSGDKDDRRSSAPRCPGLVFTGGASKELPCGMDCSIGPTRTGQVRLFRTLYGHLVLSGNAWVNPVGEAGGLPVFSSLRPERMRVIEGRMAGPWPMSSSGRAAADACGPARGGAGAALQAFLRSTINWDLRGW